MNFPAKITRYRTIEKLFMNFFGCKRNEVYDYVIGTGAEGEPTVEITVKDVIESIKNEQKIWGYVDKDSIVHVWFDKTVSPEMLFRFFAHEAGHLNGKKYKDNNKEEIKAVEFENVGSYAYSMVKKYLKN